ncbi:unnamed protein product [Sphagnum jensenii]|uniref:Alpha-1,6-mannosyltransferase n=1 Tax=Sphagnum jensenii TaxID=128206 RepID=A0ABP1B2J8_9BRYO
MAALQCLESSWNEDAEFRYWWSSSVRLLRALLLMIGSLLLLCVLCFYGPGLWLTRANELGRQCMEVRKSWPHNNKNQYHQHHPHHNRFALVTCSDGLTTIPQRSFEGMMELITPNRKRYVERHGYQFIDASGTLDKDRPPSWSKILAVKTHLSAYDCVFWNDADSVITNPTIALEDIIYSVVGDAEFDNMPDFIVSEDVTGVNAGMFFFRNSEWSRQFLDRWWNQTDFVKPFGQSKSGDNSALKYLIRSMPENERKQHVRIPRMQCLFNSNLWRPSSRSCHRLLTATKSVWQGVHARGDFMVHLAGLDDKKKWIRQVLQDLRGEKFDERTTQEKGTALTMSRKESLPFRQWWKY